MAPLAHTLALLAMTMATAAIEEVPVDMAWDSFDDQYLTCSVKMSEKLPELQDSDFRNNAKFKDDWKKATDRWKEQQSNPSPLTQDQAIALMAYTMQDTYDDFNKAVREAGKSSEKYRNEFHFKSLHFLLTRALQTLRRADKCQDVFRGVSNYHFNVNENDKFRFGQFASTSLSEEEAQKFGQDTMFKVHTCHGVDIQKFSMYPEEEEVLIPPFETFKVIAVRKEGKTIELRSTGNSSNYECEWLKGGSLSRNSPHLGGLLLATVAMAVATGTL